MINLKKLEKVNKYVFCFKEDGEFVLCELDKSEGVYVLNIAYGKTLEDLQSECDLIFQENVIDVKSLTIIEGE